MLNRRPEPFKVRVLDGRLVAILLVASWVSGCASSNATGSGASPIPSPSGSPGPAASVTVSNTPAPTIPSKAFTLAAVDLSLYVDPQAALLANGRVLIVDGPSNIGVRLRSDTVQIYDPVVNTTSLTSSMVPGGVARVLTTLNDGRVLSTGAFPDSAAEIYDPSTGRFSLTGRMVDGNRASEEQSFDVGYTATTLKDGRVLIVGGFHYNSNLDDQTFLRSAELYDPATGKFTPTGSLKTGRENHTATLLKDGRVLIAGGDEDPLYKYLASAEIYDPVTGRFSPAGAMTTPRTGQTATLLADGRVLLAGGDNADSSAFAAAEIYDPSTGKFTKTGSLVTGRSGQAACSLDDGSVLIVGGYDSGNPSQPLSSAEVYKPAAGTFSEVPGALRSALDATQAIRLPGGQVFILADVAEMYWP
jgi:hypothetical protein